MLKVNDKNLYVHYPKTGGTFVREILKRYCKNQRIESNWYHSSHLILENVDIKDFEFTFATVRNPVEWYQSAWKFLNDFLKRGKFREDEWNPLMPLEDCYNDDFNKFIENCLNQYPSYYSNSLKLYLGENYNAIDFVLKTETLSFDICKVLERINVKHNPVDILNCPKFGQRVRPLTWDDSLKKQIIKNEMNVIQTFYL